MKFSPPALPLINRLSSLDRPVRLFLLAAALDGLALSMWMLFFNFYILSLGFDREFLGQANSAAGAAALILGLPLGLLSDRLGPRRAMLFGVCLYLGAAGLEVVLTQPVLILLMAFLAGAGHTMYFINKAPLIMKVSNPINRTFLFSLNFSLAYLAGAAGSLLGGLIYSIGGRIIQAPPSSAGIYRLVLISSLITSAMMLIPLAYIRIHSSGKGQSHTLISAGIKKGASVRASMKAVLTRPVIWKLALIQITTGVGAALLVPFINLFLSEKFLLSGQELGLIFSLKSLITGMGIMVGPVLVMRLGSKVKAAVVTLAMGAGFLLLLGFSPILWPALIGFYIGGTLINISAPVMDAFSMEQVEENSQATFSSIRELSWQGSWTIGPYLSGIIQNQAGYPPIFIGSTASFALASALLGLLFLKQEHNGLQVITKNAR